MMIEGMLEARRSATSRMALFVFVLCAEACASAAPAPRPGTGDISFRLTWDGEADLDLYVASPLGEMVDFHNRSVLSGGALDVDCNVRQTDSVYMCPEPMENIFWPRGMAPPGTFQYWAVLAYPREADPKDEYLLQVRIGERLVGEHAGRVADLRDHGVIYEIDFPPPES